MVRSVALLEEATRENFDEERYLAANPDIREAVRTGVVASGARHFSAYGKKEGRRQRTGGALDALRAAKMERVAAVLNLDGPHTVDGAGRYNFLTEALRAETGIADTDNVSANEYDPIARGMIDACPDGLILDCGAGFRGVYYENVVNFEIVAYDSTDVLGVGEHLPFKDDSFDGVFSFAVLEHVRDPFRCAEEIARVLKPGGQLYCAIPFLQPVHGYPHHYFNATPQGLRRLFEERLEVEQLFVPASGHPVWALSWILQKWAAGLPPQARARFEKMTVGELSSAPQDLLGLPACAELSQTAQFELACLTGLIGRKPL